MGSKLNASHQNGLITRVREYSREIKAAIKAGDVERADVLAASRQQIMAMARSAGCNVRKLNAASA